MAEITKATNAVTVVIVIRFENVGRSKKTWTKEFRFRGNVVDADALIREIKKNGGVMSRDIDVEMDENRSGGNVLAGAYTIGSWRIVEE